MVQRSLFVCLEREKVFALDRVEHSPCQFWFRSIEFTYETWDMNKRRRSILRYAMLCSALLCFSPNFSPSLSPSPKLFGLCRAFRWECSCQDWFNLWCSKHLGKEVKEPAPKPAMPCDNRGRTSSAIGPVRQFRFLREGNEREKEKAKTKKQSHSPA
jgi:hypothetical protein